MHELMLRVKKVVSDITHLIFPTKCVECKSIGESLCGNCRAQIPLSQNRNSPFCSVYQYSSPTMHKAIWSLKYKNNKEMAKVFARSLYDVMLEDISIKRMLHSFDKPLLIPIPLHPIRKRQRGYNQSELICRELSFIDPDLSSPCYNVLYRNRETESQARTTSKQKRLGNVKNCFSIQNKNVVTGKHVLLVDDIATTGATLSEAAKVLKKAGARSVTCYVIAH